MRGEKQAVKKWISGFIACVLVASPLSAFAAQSAFKIGNGNYSINGTIKQDAEPYIKNGRTYLPLRYAAYSVGIGDNSIFWSNDTHTAFLAKNGTIMAVKIGAHSIQVGNQTIPVDAPAEMYKDRVMLPIRAIAEGLGCNVQWDEKDNMVIVKTKD
jgi:hypothetical protein